MSLPVIPFSRPYKTSNELRNLAAVLESGHVHGDGAFTAAASARLREITGAPTALLTTSCTHALEMASILLELGPGDEVILPSYTFPSAATAVVLAGATPVFVDIDPATGNIDPQAVEAAVTDRTAAISVMHYGGVAVDMDSILPIAAREGVAVIEDNAHGLGGSLNGRQLGTMGTFGTQSFHDTKNVHSGEGGALLVNDARYTERAEIVREKGTNRSRFLRGQVDKYTWTDSGSSYLMSELNAAVLDSQLSEFDAIQSLRHRVWNRYATELAGWAESTGTQLMTVPSNRRHTAHMFWALMTDHEAQDALLSHLRSQGVVGTFHYLPLEVSPAGQRFGRAPALCSNSQSFASRLVRLPLSADLSDDEIDRVVEAVASFRPDHGA